MNMLNGLKLRHLEAFLAVSQSGTISAAARARNVSQPALSKTIGELEALLGTPLLERTARRAVLTPAGESFRVHALTALQSLETGMRNLSGKGTSGLIKVGVLPSVAGDFFPSVALELHHSRPDLRIGVITGPNGYLLEKLRSGGVDLVVGRMPSAKNMPGLSFEHLYDEPVVLVARRHHPALPCTAPDVLTSYPLIVPNPGAIIRQKVDQYLAAQGLSGLVPAFEAVALPVALSLIEQSDMLWFISRGVVERELKRGTLITLDLKADYMAGAVGITRKFDFDKNSPTELLVRLLHKQAEQVHT
ncbi:LysR substrate-binding domain-containing protein [Nitratireductor aquimarinus]|uniref:LysR substrate-binding domain-containing protein n=1 Tax=Nitratireductor aquimarinus TaxID=889300 RepID=A0ABU4AM22_9HYPH|nr:LysR substrate-binding domain-containing protein [Nitratireductor aquimarinus]MDV6227290.1 LysR substrate-binding domain-containing protein [Nitratireductor aquimarinus]